MRLFVDMDGTLAEWRSASTADELYQEGYFRNLQPVSSILAATKILARREDVEVYVLSSVLGDSPYAKTEKNSWLDKYLPEIPRDYRLFPPCGTEKALAVPGGIRRSDILLDDYTSNLISWSRYGTAVKVLNGINGTNGKWASIGGQSVSSKWSAKRIASYIYRRNSV